MTTVLEYLYAACKKTPDKIVYQDAEKGITFRQALEYAQRIASYIAARIPDINVPIAITVDRNTESLCAFLGVAMTRNFYVPIDCTQPAQRILTILGQMRPAALIEAGTVTDELRAGAGLPVYAYSDMVSCEIDDAKLDRYRKTAMDTDPLYAICTSGSTGIPKGVIKCHRSVLDFIPVFTETFGLTENDVFGNQAPFDFDVSVKDIYSALYLGATVQIIPKVCFSVPKKLVELLDDKKVTTLIWAVSALCIVAGFNAFKHRVPAAIRHVLFSGEVMPIKMLNIWRSCVPEATYVNLYGPTEVTCNCLYYVIDRDFGPTEKIPLGKPFPNQGVLFLNEENREIRPGEIGEIFVKGSCIAMGYYNNPQGTAAAFIQNPMQNAYPETVYRTGDLAELHEDGQYYFAARRDFQIKHMGHRIELEEIETYLCAVPNVIRASCLFDKEREKIVAYYMGDIDKTEIIEYLKKDLPKYMVPNIFIRLDALPLNKNGKIDRQQLRNLYFSKE